MIFYAMKKILDICKVAVKLGIVNFKVTGGVTNGKKRISFFFKTAQTTGGRETGNSYNQWLITRCTYYG